MRNGQNKHRMRGRNRGSNGGGKNHNPLTRVYESNGPDVKIRGTASHIAEKYIQLARDAAASGDPVAAENYYQHAEHYFRLIAAAQEQFRQNQPFQQRSDLLDDNFDDTDEQPGFGVEPHSPREAQPYQQQPQPYPQDRPQRQEQRPRHERQQRDNRRDEGQQEGRQRDAQGRDAQGQDEGRQFESRQPAHNSGESDIDRLPSFITGAPAPSASANGHEGAADRFPLNRRRRRPRTPRAEMAGSTEGGEDAAPPASE